jgi:hypothetical protein
MMCSNFDPFIVYGKFDYFGLNISGVTFLDGFDQRTKFQENQNTLAKWVANLHKKSSLKWWFGFFLAALIIIYSVYIYRWYLWSVI